MLPILAWQNVEYRSWFDVREFGPGLVSMTPEQASSITVRKARPGSCPQCQIETYMLRSLTALVIYLEKLNILHYTYNRLNNANDSQISG